jgi:hypothetical protein
VAALCLAVTPALAGLGDRNVHWPGRGWGPPPTRGAPGPLLGAGLPVLVALAGYGAWRATRRRTEAPDRHADRTD